MTAPASFEKDPETISIADAKARFADLVRRAEAGERIVLTRHGRPVAELTPSADSKPRKKLHGALKGEIKIAPDFDALGTEWDEYTR
ncbi:type II toxin-antitoxin system prevent-host-death family antitoxin [Mesorhizobium sp. NBSH29]|uniref:type II toxin-antitoxin system Phd/YefM family antitoxin n=1 Tax=Mesorhizobium sp. NBSH29 TaxID=2654249 RepID=UPI0018965115|nr:type II toxin-antitoxin system prevent-host-death family antitoxin [Mesorhizobium sp. NBSH29]QPC86886.1 type II toxin-antitoxin system prevent-host-death family antitoxin [Mesorhizobium sp. NBSH29]